MLAIEKEPDSIAAQIRDHLRAHPDLRRDDYGGHPLAGHCYVASEAYFHATGGYDQWDVCRTVHEGTTHWFLADDPIVVDLTAEQFDREPTYAGATRTGFLTDEPSERAQRVLDAISQDSSAHARHRPDDQRDDRARRPAY